MHCARVGTIDNAYWYVLLSLVEYRTIRLTHCSLVIDILTLGYAVR